MSVQTLQSDSFILFFLCFDLVEDCWCIINSSFAFPHSIFLFTYYNQKRTLEAVITAWQTNFL